MKYIIYLVIIFFIYSKFVSKSKKQKTKKAKQKTKVINRKETANESIFIIDVDDTFELSCHIKKEGSPWVKVYIKGFEENDYSYNAKNFKWKNGNSPDLHDDPKKINKIIREEWNKASAKYNWTFESSLPQKKSPPITADITTKEIQLQYEISQLENLKEAIEIIGSEEQVYIINLKNLSCNCPDFVKRRSGFPQTDIRRICKHQARAIIQSKLNTKITNNKKIQAIIRGSKDKGFFIFEKCIEITFNENVKGPKEFYLFVERNNKWVNVVSFSTKSFSKNDYNMTENRWARGDNPFPTGFKKKYTKAIQMTLTEYNYIQQSK